MNISIKSIFMIIAVAVLTSACGNSDDTVVLRQLSFSDSFITECMESKRYVDER